NGEHGVDDDNDADGEPGDIDISDDDVYEARELVAVSPLSVRRQPDAGMSMGRGCASGTPRCLDGRGIKSSCTSNDSALGEIECLIPPCLLLWAA
ncbi:hypothetical protein LPJ75_006111, partial [Coemansia sp. RSA 2598]